MRGLVEMKLKVASLAIAVFVGPAFVQAAWSAEEDVVAYRKSNMTLLKGHMGSLVALVKEKFRMWIMPLSMRQALQRRPV